MTDQPPPSRNVMEAAEGLARSVVGGLVSTPTLLVMVVLNVAMIIAAAWFLERQEAHRHAEALAVLKLVEKAAYWQTPSRPDVP